MSSQGQQLLAEALSLPPEERVELAEKLLFSLRTDEQQEIDALWAAEAESRLDAMKQGLLESIPAEEVFRSLKKS